MKKTFNQGFTLIELLVVIAIIGILSGVVLTSLNSARNKAKDARVEASVAQIRSIAEQNYENGSYADFNSAAASLSADITAQGGTLTVSTLPASAYRAYATLPSDTAQIWCVDSVGNSQKMALSALPVAPSVACK